MHALCIDWDRTLIEGFAASYKEYKRSKERANRASCRTFDPRTDLIGMFRARFGTLYPHM